jgi:hypothetical protein
MPVAFARTVIGYTPGTTAPVVVSVNVLDVATTDAGAKLGVTPAGAPVAVSATAPAKSLSRVIVTVDVPALPACTDTAVGDAAIVNVPAGGGGGGGGVTGAFTDNGTTIERVATFVPVAVTVTA